MPARRTPLLVGTTGFALLERAMGYTLGSLLLVNPGLMRRATPCRDWELGELLVHMNDSLASLHEAVAVRRVALGPHAFGDPTADPVSSLKNRACRMMGEWATSDGAAPVAIDDLSLPTGLVAAAGAVEVAVHGWDVSVACGAPRPVPEALAAELVGVAAIVVTAEDRPERFAPPLAVPDGAGQSERLLAFLGRDPRA